MLQHKVVANILADRNNKVVLAEGVAFAPSNIALAKYWGKKDLTLNLPNTNSLSISLGDNGATTKIKIIDAKQDKIILNNKEVASNADFYLRLVKFLDLFRFDKQYNYLIDTNTNIPVAAGIASSACGFAAVVMALNNLFGWELTKTQQSILARLGSGSAARSLWHGFVEWHRGSDDLLGMDSYAKSMPNTWPELRVGLLLLDSRKKKISSRDAMLNSVKSSPFYKVWPEVVANDIQSLKQAINTLDFELLGKTSEQNAISMHSLMHTSTPPIMYSNSDTIAAMQKVWQLRNSKNLPVYFTQDAGPNLKLLFLESEENIVRKNFEEIIMIKPFDKLKAKSYARNILALD